MSSTSQTPTPRGAGARRMWGVGLALAAVLGVALGPRLSLVARAVARLHLPTAAALARLPPVIAIHLSAALAALALGAALMLVRKGRRFHRVGGWIWVVLVALVAGSSLFITTLHPGRYSVLHLLTGWTLIILPLAVFWARRHEVARHRRIMTGLFYGGFAINIFIAFIPGRTMWMLVFG